MTAPTDALVERLRGLLAKATPVRDTWRLRVKDDGEERYELIGDPCGFPVAIFGHHSDAELDLAFRFALPALLAERASLLARIEAAEKALEPLLKGWAAFTDDGTGWGNHEEAYQCLAKGMDEHWSAAAQWQAGR